MKVSVENLGPIRYAEFETGKLTIICGLNNSGKTYVTYALYGFLQFWQSMYHIKIEKEVIKELKENGVCKIPLSRYTDKSQEIISDACEKYRETLPSVFSAHGKLFEGSSFKITVNPCDVVPLNDEVSLGFKPSSSKIAGLLFHKEKNEKEITATLFTENTKGEIPDNSITYYLSQVIKEVVFNCVFPSVFIASTERTGISVFRKELNSTRSRLFEQIFDTDAKRNYLINHTFDYALPVERNINFSRDLESVSKKESFLVKDHKEILDFFTDILGGDFQVATNSGLYFLPSKKDVKLTMGESSSSVRSLLEIGFYLKHEAQENDLLIIDEPELNLHPENQRKVARLIASLINCGISVFITTHSDYILRELSNLILLNKKTPHIVQLAEREGYSQRELIRASDIKIYAAKEGNDLIQTLVPTVVDEESGILSSCFDDTIDTMNRIQDEIFFGG